MMVTMKRTKFFYALLFAGVALFVAGCIPWERTRAENTKMRLVWADEFNYSGLPDTTKWSYDLGNGCPNICGWGNNELQFYHAHRLENARVENGRLVIEAHRENTGYTSARMVTKNKADWKYGRVEVRAKLPKGRGVWPAIWMLPTHWEYGGWPRSGEIDIMENVGYLPDSVYGSLHTQRFNHLQGTQVTAGVLSTTLHSEYHTYSLSWDAAQIEFFFDGQKFQSFPNRHEGPDAWPFDRPFYLILNVAVGGNWGGSRGVDESIWPQKMEVDWVRVYQRAP